MLNKLFAAFVVAVILVAGFLYASKFQSLAKVNTQDDQIVGLLNQMRVADWKSRRIAFYELLELGFESKFKHYHIGMGLLWFKSNNG